MTVNELSNKYPSIPWEQFLNNLLSGITTVEKNEVINVVEPNFIAGLEKLLKTTSPRVLANYVSWRNIRDSISFIHNEKLRSIEIYFRAQWSN